MSVFKLTFQEEVRRLARKEVKAYSETLAAQQKTIRELTKRIEALEKKQAVPVVPKADKPAEVVVPAKSGKARFSPKTIIKFRYDNIITNSCTIEACPVVTKFIK